MKGQLMFTATALGINMYCMNGHGPVKSPSFFHSYKLAAARRPPAAATMAEGLKWRAVTRRVGLPMA
jgi:hypothetical protein